jgi:ABC-type Mn2+/Zn2+ transport system permease subunit
VRQEANIAHTFAHIGLLGVAIWLRFEWSVELSILWSVLGTVIFLYILSTREQQNQTTHNEIGAQLWLVWAILLVSQMTWYRADITSYLFWDILLLWVQDIILISSIVWITGLMYYFFSDKRYALSLHKSLAASKGVNTTLSYLLYLIALGVLIWWAMKLIGVLLVSAFLILPSSISKWVASNIFQWKLFSSSICITLSSVALFLSWHYDMPSWASIVGCMIVLYLLVEVYKQVKR